MEKAIKSLLSLDYAVTTFTLKYDTERCKKVLHFKRCWQQANVQSYQEFVDYKDNAVAIITGEASDLLVNDADCLKPKEQGTVQDGLELLNGLIMQHGLPDGNPVQITGSGGKHLFFSASGSLRDGLLLANNRSKLYVDGKPTSLNVRGDGGGIICAPTKYIAGREERTYAFETPLCSVDTLPAAPMWLITLLNKDSERQKPYVVKAMSGAALNRPQPSQATHVSKSVLEDAMENIVDKMWPRQSGFDSSVVHKDKPCMCCDGQHTSNNYAYRAILTSYFVIYNYSTACKPKAFGYNEHPDIRSILASPTSDDPYVSLLKKKYDAAGMHLKASGDEKNPSFFLYEGNRWREMPDIELRQAVRMTAAEIFQKLSVHLRTDLTDAKNNGKETSGLQTQLKSLKQAQTHVQRSSNIKSMSASAKDLLWDQEFAARLDTCANLLGVSNGVVNLVTGKQYCRH